MAMGKIRVDICSRYPYPRAKIRTRARARYPPRAQNDTRTHYPRIDRACGGWNGPPASARREEGEGRSGGGGLVVGGAQEGGGRCVAVGSGRLRGEC